MHLFVAFVAAIIDRLLPTPEALVRAIGHPVMWMGSAIERIENDLNLPDMPAAERRNNGVLMLAVLVATSVAAARLLQIGLGFLPLSWLLEAAIATIFLAHNELAGSVRAVAIALGRSPDEAREAVGQIVGRDTSEMSEAEISRAAIESLAENSSDGLIAPLFWLALFGLPGIVAYKAINTADSMVGHRTERYAAFGWASARLDDWVNWLPARLTGLFYVAGAAFLSRGSPRDAWETMLRDARRHASPNAGWPEAALAGALGYGLGGPRAYGGEVLRLAQMGDGRRDLDAGDIRLSLQLYDLMTTVALGVLGVLTVMTI